MILFSRRRTRPGARGGARPGPGILLLALLPLFLALFILGAATPAALLVLLSAAAALLLLLLTLALGLLATGPAVGARSCSVDKKTNAQLLSPTWILIPTLSKCYFLVLKWICNLNELD